MRWSKILRSDSDPAQRELTAVLEFKPKDFELGTPQVALNYLDFKRQGSDFVMSDVIRATTGVEQIEKDTEESKIESAVLERVALIQRQAYDEGFRLGSEEGFKDAFEKKTNDLNASIDQVYKLLAGLNDLKKEMITQNERHFVALIYDLAERIAFLEIERRPEAVMNIITKAIEQAQLQEEIKVSVNPTQLEFIESIKSKQEQKNEVLKNVKIQASEEVKAGGCIIETNYGVIDAQVHERTEKLWEELAALLPKAAEFKSEG